MNYRQAKKEYKKAHGCNPMSAKSIIKKIKAFAADARTIVEVWKKAEDIIVNERIHDRMRKYKDEYYL